MLLAAVIEEVVPLDEAGGRASFAAKSRTVVVRDGLGDGWCPGVVIMHLSSMVMLHGRLPLDAEWRVYLLDRLATQMRHIGTCQDETGALAEEWVGWV